MKQIFINLPVNDLTKSTEFYLALGFTLYPVFTDENQICLCWTDNILVMLQSKQSFQDYLKKPWADARKFQSLSHTLPVESILKVNTLMEAGLSAGGKEPVPALDEGFMFLRSIEDLDGYVWGIIFLDEEKFISDKNKDLDS